MDEKKVFIFEQPQKPEIENLKEVVADCSEFSEPEKAKALIKNLRLSIGDIIKEHGDSYFIINPKMVLEGDTPEKYKREIEEVKNILTESEKKQISLYYRRKKEDDKIRDKLYYGITKRVEKLYNWDDENKKHKPKTNSKRNISVCKSLDWISDHNHLSGFDNLIYHILDKKESNWVYCYRQAWFNKPIPNIQEWRETDEGEYHVLTDSEADYQAEEYLTDDDSLWKQAVESGNTTDSLEDWAEYVLRMDGRGSILSGYDGSEDFETINGTDYYIYRTN